MNLKQGDLVRVRRFFSQSSFSILLGELVSRPGIDPPPYSVNIHGIGYENVSPENIICKEVPISLSENELAMIAAALWDEQQYCENGPIGNWKYDALNSLIQAIEVLLGKPVRQIYDHDWWSDQDGCHPRCQLPNLADQKPAAAHY